MYIEQVESCRITRPALRCKDLSQVPDAKICQLTIPEQAELVSIQLIQLKHAAGGCEVCPS